MEADGGCRITPLPILHLNNVEEKEEALSRRREERCPRGILTGENQGRSFLARVEIRSIGDPKHEISFHELWRGRSGHAGCLELVAGFRACCSEWSPCCEAGR